MTYLQSLAEHGCAGAARVAIIVPVNVIDNWLDSELAKWLQHYSRAPLARTRDPPLARTRDRDAHRLTMVRAMAPCWPFVAPSDYVPPVTLASAGRHAWWIGLRCSYVLL